MLTVGLALVLVLSAPAMASHGAIADAGTPENIEAGEETQEIEGIAVDLEEPGADNVDVYINVTSLETANIDLDSINVDVGSVTDAEHTDTDVNQDDGNTVVRVTFDADENADSFTVDSVTLTQLATGDADEMTGLTYDVAHSDEELVGDAAPDADDHQTAAFDIITDDGATDDSTDDGADTDDSTTTDDDADADDGADTDDTETDDTAMDDDAADTDDDADDDGAGFGVVVALTALLGAAVIAYRR